MSNGQDALLLLHICSIHRWNVRGRDIDQEEIGSSSSSFSFRCHHLLYSSPGLVPKTEIVVFFQENRNGLLVACDSPEKTCFLKCTISKYYTAPKENWWLFCRCRPSFWSTWHSRINELDIWMDINGSPPVDQPISINEGSKFTWQAPLKLWFWTICQF